MVAWAGDYATTAELKAHLRITDTADDTYIGQCVTSASRAIDHATNRQFGVEGVAVARTYTGDCAYILDNRWALPIDDLSSVTGLVIAYDIDDDGTYSQTVTLGTDVALWPYNASRNGKPWTHLVQPATAQWTFPWTSNSIRVTGLYGWLAVPSVVKTACLIQAARFFVRRDSAYGVAGSPELGNELRLLDRLDPDVALLLTGVKRHWGAV